MSHQTIYMVVIRVIEGFGFLHTHPRIKILLVTIPGFIIPLSSIAARWPSLFLVRFLEPVRLCFLDLREVVYNAIQGWSAVRLRVYLGQITEK